MKAHYFWGIIPHVADSARCLDMGQRKSLHYCDLRPCTLLLTLWSCLCAHAIPLFSSLHVLCVMVHVATCVLVKLHKPRHTRELCTPSNVCFVQTLDFLDYFAGWLCHISFVHFVESTGQSTETVRYPHARTLSHKNHYGFSVCRVAAHHCLLRTPAEGRARIKSCN